MEGQTRPVKIQLPPDDQVRVEVAGGKAVEIAEFLSAVWAGEDVVGELRGELLAAVRAVHLKIGFVVHRVESLLVVFADFLVEARPPDAPFGRRRRIQRILPHDGDMAKLQAAVDDFYGLMTVRHALLEVLPRMREGNKMAAVGTAHAALLHVGIHRRAALHAGQHADSDLSMFKVRHSSASFGEF